MIKQYFKKVINKLLECFWPAPRIMTSEETIRQMAEEGQSLGRFGDGEMMLLLNSGDLKFQRRDSLLAKRLAQVLSSKEEGFLVGLPLVFTKNDLHTRNASSADFWRDNLRNTRLEWYRRIDLRRSYANSTFTRNYLTLKDKTSSEAYFKQVRSIWEQRHVLVVEGEKSRVGVGNPLFSNALEVKRIICPSENAFSCYQQILDTVRKLPKDHLVLISLGPTATVLAFDLFRSGYQAIDIGHIDIEFEWFLRGSTEREMIPGKDVAEAGGMIEDNLYLNAEYHNQIVGIITV